MDASGVRIARFIDDVVKGQAYGILRVFDGHVGICFFFDGSADPEVFPPLHDYLRILTELELAYKTITVHTGDSAEYSAQVMFENYKLDEKVTVTIRTEDGRVVLTIDTEADGSVTVHMGLSECSTWTAVMKEMLALAHAGMSSIHNAAGVEIPPRNRIADKGLP